MRDLSRSLLLLDGEPKTLRIESVRKISPYAYHVCFKNGKRTYTYRSEKVIWLSDPQWIQPDSCKIYRSGVLQTDITEILRFKYGKNVYWRIKFRSGYEAEYAAGQINVVTNCLNNRQARNIFSYMRNVAAVNPLGKENGEKGILSSLYDRIDFVDDRTVAACYLNPSQNAIKGLNHGELIYPFGCNASQKKAVDTAFEHQLSVIQGPPGTGKTQTILNIIANIVSRGKTVMVVSNNNSAIANVREKLDKYGMSFIVAALGKQENKEIFIEEQPVIPQILKTWKCSLEDRQQMKTRLRLVLEKLDTVYALQNELAETVQEQQVVELEWKHFCLSNEVGTDVKLHKGKSSRIVGLWLQCQTIAESMAYRSKNHFMWIVNRIKCLWLTLKCRYGFKLHNKFDLNNLEPLITELQMLYYLNRRVEIARRIGRIRQMLSDCDTGSMAKELTDTSMMLLKSALYDRYGKYDREVFDGVKDMKVRGKEFMEQYPVVLSTAFSAETCRLCDEPYDYVLMDEASQVSVETGVLALTCAKNAVIVGDTLQLPNVLTDEDRSKLEAVMKDYDIPAGYDCAGNSFLQSVCVVINNVPQTLLREHYRCHPKIINFCNQKFYGGNLLIMTHDEGEKDVLRAIRTVKGNHAVNQYNQREIDVIKQEVLPAFRDFESIGVVTPYNHQVAGFQRQLPEVETATIHKYQGREKDVIIMSVVDNRITAFADDPNLLNVAVSRAKKKFCLVVTGNEQEHGGNIMDLLDYIDYNNCTVTDSKVASVFDYLYGQYSDRRISFLKSHPKISEYASENLTYSMICEVLSSHESFACLKVFCHIPLRRIIRDTSLMSEDESHYAENYHTHVDFLIANRVSKKPVLAIETDGYAYHNSATEQYRRDKLKNHIFEVYRIPLLRLSTKGSEEKRRVETALLELV